MERTQLLKFIMSEYDFVVLLFSKDGTKTDTIKSALYDCSQR